MKKLGLARARRNMHLPPPISPSKVNSFSHIAVNKKQILTSMMGKKDTYFYGISYLRVVYPNRSQNFT